MQKQVMVTLLESDQQNKVEIETLLVSIEWRSLFGKLRITLHDLSSQKDDLEIVKYHRIN